MLYTLFLNSVKVHTLKRGLFSFILSGKIYLVCTIYWQDFLAFFFKLLAVKKDLLSVGSKKEKEKKRLNHVKASIHLTLIFHCHSLDQSASFFLTEVTQN